MKILFILLNFNIKDLNNYFIKDSKIIIIIIVIVVIIILVIVNYLIKLLFNGFKIRKLLFLKDLIAYKKS